MPVLYEKLVSGSGVEEVCATVTVSAHLNCRFVFKLAMCLKINLSSSCGCPSPECGPNQIFEERTCECRFVFNFLLNLLEVPINITELLLSITD